MRMKVLLVVLCIIVTSTVRRQTLCNHINLVQCCSRSPITGGKHLQASKFCSEHQYLDTSSSAISSQPTSLTVSIPRHAIHTPSFTSANLGTLPDSDSAELLRGCCKQCNVNHFFDRTAGVAAAVRP